MLKAENLIVAEARLRGSVVLSQDRLIDAKVTLGLGDAAEYYG